MDDGVNVRDAIARGHLAWLIGSLCNLHRVPFDVRLLEQEFPPPHTHLSLLNALEAFGMKCGELPWRGASPKSLIFPCIAFVRDVPVEGPSPNPEAIPRLVRSESVAVRRGGRAHTGADSQDRCRSHPVPDAERSRANDCRSS